MKLLGATARTGEPVMNMTELAKLAAQNPQAALLFSVEWLKGGKFVSHTLIAVRGLYGGLKIIDRSGAVVKSLAELGKLVPFYGPIGSAVMVGETVIVENSMVVKSMGLIPSLANVLSHAAGSPPEQVTIPLDHVSVKPGATNGNLGAMNGGHGSAIHSLGGVHHHRSHGAELSPTAKKIYPALGTGLTAVTYRQIMERTHLHIDDVIRGVQELVDKRKAT